LKVIYERQGTILKFFLDLKSQGDEIPISNEFIVHTTFDLQNVSVKLDENYIIIREKALSSI
jgi:hypothetical protein